MKRKLTLSIDENVIRNAKSILALENKTVSQVVEDDLKRLSLRYEIENAMKDNGIEYIDINDSYIIKNREKMKKTDSIDIIKEIRNDYDERLSGY
ncbi:DUF6364 family protein [Ferroplasma sp.]|uniref:DUF6364 family protein n=1 Tax=Ferroplasma sp. TaxID=2591003 RepID=UPI00307E1168